VDALFVTAGIKEEHVHGHGRGITEGQGPMVDLYVSVSPRVGFGQFLKPSVEGFLCFTQL
jgi:hypothetical protein